MISEDFVEAWKENANWKLLDMVEQDLIISRALICLYSHPEIKTNLVFRGGTCLNKLFIKPPARYSEDIDFVQRLQGPIGKTIDAIREVLLPWLGEPKRKITERGVKLIYKYISVGNLPAKLKIEINTSEHFQVLSLRQEHFSIQSEWFEGSCDISTYDFEELMATKLRALYQRRKGRDLFDIWYVFNSCSVNIDQVIHVFHKYCEKEGARISKDLFKNNMEEKRLNTDFRIDMSLLLPPGMNWNFDEAFIFFQENIIEKI